MLKADNNEKVIQEEETLKIYQKRTYEGKKKTGNIKPYIENSTNKHKKHGPMCHGGG